jgi:tetratricopeptide (TPR) repeat protein
MGLGEDLPGLLKDAKTAATRALRLNGHDEYAHWILGLISMGLGEFDTAVAELERAIEINPNCSLAYGSLGTILNFVGRPEESIANNEIAIRVNPRDPSIFFRYSGLALSYFLLDECETAVEWARKSVREKPDWFQGHAMLVAGYARLNRMEDARAALGEYLSNFPTASISDFLRIPFQNPEHSERLTVALRKAGLPE